MVQREDEMGYAHSGIKDLLLMGAILFAVLFTLVSLPLSTYLLQHEWLVVVIGIAVYALIVGILWFGKRYYLLWWEQMPHFLRYELNRRTGVQRLDGVGLLLSVALILLFLFTARWLLPLAIVGAIAFFALMLTPVDYWKVQERSRFRPPVPVPAPEPEFTDGYETHTYRWDFERGSQELFEGFLQIRLKTQRYEEFRDKNPFQNWPDIPPYQEVIRELVLSGITDEVRHAAARFMQMTEQERFSRYEEITNVMAFVQEAIEYDLSIEQGRDYWRYPIETLRDHLGDCDCKSILAAALLFTLRHKVVILIGQDHMAIAVAGAAGLPGTFYELDGERYYYCEVTGEGWTIGELPQTRSPHEFRPYRIEGTAGDEAA